MDYAECRDAYFYGWLGRISTAGGARELHRVARRDRASALDGGGRFSDLEDCHPHRHSHLIRSDRRFFDGHLGCAKIRGELEGRGRRLCGRICRFFCAPPLFWLIVGPIAGAVVGELAAGRTFREGGKAGVGAVVGGIIAFALKFGISMCVIALFFFDLFLF